MAANKPKNFEEAEKELEQYGSWVKGSPEDLETDNLDIDFAIDGDPENALMTEEEEMLLGELESSETESSFGDISFDEFGDLDDEEDDTFGMELPDDDFTGGQAKNPDLSMKILQSIENELVGLRNEVKDLKKELSQIQKSPESSMSFPPEAEAQSTGFFDEDDDETIALTGDELDNILESASVEVEPDLDDIISTGEGDEIPEEFNESNILDEDEFQDTEDLIGNTELDDSLLDDLSLGEDDPALAELTEIDDDFMSEELIINNDIPEDFDLDDIPDMDDSGESFEIDGESFSVEEFEGSDGDSFTVEEYSADENSPSLSEMSGNEELVESYISENRIEESFIIEEDEDGVFDEGEEIDIAVEEELDGGSFSESEKSVPFEDLEDIDLSSFDDNLVEESSDGDFEQIDVNSFLDEENEITVDIGPDNEIAFDEISIDEEALEPGPDLTEEVGISFDEELPEEDTEFSLDEIEIEEDSDDFGSEDLTLDEISLEEELPEEDTEFSLGEIEIEEDSDDFGSEDLTLDEISLDDELLEEDTEFSLDEIEIEDDSDDFGSEDLTLDEISLEEEEPEEDTEFSLDEIEIEEDSDDFGSEDLTLDEISLEEELPEEDTEFSLDEIEIEEDSDDFGSEDLTLDEISLEEEEPEDDTEFSLDETVIEEDSDDFGSEDLTLDEISLEEVLPDEDSEISLDNILSASEIETTDEIAEEEISLEEIILEEENDSEDTDELIIEDEPDEITIDSVFPEEEILLNDINSDTPEPDFADFSDDLSLEGTGFEDEIELPDLDEIMMNTEEEEEINLPDLDEISLEDDYDNNRNDAENQNLIDSEIETIEDIELPDLDEIIIDDEETEVPNLDAIIADSSDMENGMELSEIELPDLDDIIIDDDDEDSQDQENGADDDIFGGESELVDLDSLEQLAVEEPENEMTPREFTEDLSERVEEIRDAAMNGNIPEELRDEIKDILLYMDQLLESLPDEKIQEFARSEHFEVYKKIFEELGIKK